MLATGRKRKCIEPCLKFKGQRAWSQAASAMEDSTLFEIRTSSTFTRAGATWRHLNVTLGYLTPCASSKRSNRCLIILSRSLSLSSFGSRLRIADVGVSRPIVGVAGGSQSRHSRGSRRERSNARVATWRLAHVPAERGAEGARRAVADAFGAPLEEKCTLPLFSLQTTPRV